MFTRRARPIRIIGDTDDKRPDKWSSTVYIIYTRGLGPRFEDPCRGSKKKEKEIQLRFYGLKHTT